MSRRILREQLFKLLFRVEFNDIEEMKEQCSFFFDDIDNPIEEKDMEVIQKKFDLIMDKLAEIDKQMEQYKVAIVDKGYTDYDTFYKKVCDKEALYKEKQMAKQSKGVEKYNLSSLFKEPKEANPNPYNSELSSLFKE